MIINKKLRRSFRVLKIGTIFIPIISFSAISSSSVKANNKIPKVGFFYDAPGTNITNGFNGVIFQVKNGDIYATRNETGLQVLNNN